MKKMVVNQKVFYVFPPNFMEIMERISERQGIFFVLIGKLVVSKTVRIVRWEESMIYLYQRKGFK